MSSSGSRSRVERDAATDRPPARRVGRYRWAWQLSWLLPLIGIALVALWAYGAATSWAARSSVLAGLLLLAAAAMAVGGMLGFLFGVPKVLTESGAAEAPGAPGRVTNTVRGGVSANTNLEQISDWLTKILVGIGLVQIAEAPGAFGRLVDAIAGAFGLSDAEHVIGSILLFFAVVGFLDAYLLTRLSLTGAFSEAQHGHAPVVDQQEEPS
ncbi:hypothetical protein [Blastococcus sp. SYSU DS0533]